MNPARFNPRLRGVRPRTRWATAASLAGLVALALLVGCGGDAPIEGDSDDATGDSPSGDSADGEGDGAGADDGSGDGAAPPDNQCQLAEDCVAVSSTCCDCPDFAVRIDSDFAAACGEVDCERPVECPKVVADCVDSQCVLVCEAVAATQICANGFARDAFGCLVDACRTEPPDPIVACQEDSECTEVPADCCGCGLGGADTAVNVSSVEAYLESLECRRDPACPGLDVCDASQVPRCLAGGCTLGPSSGGGSDDDGGDDGDGDGGDSGDGTADEGLCGVPEFPPCPQGQVCVLNDQDAEDATRIGVGSCRDA